MRNGLHLYAPPEVEHGDDFEADDTDPLDALLESEPELARRLWAGDSAGQDRAAWALAEKRLREAFPKEYPAVGAPGQPTEKPAGTEGKIRLMIERVEQGLTPCHADDAPPDPFEIDKIIDTNANGSVRRKGVARRKAA